MTRIARERESFARIPAASTRRLFLQAGSAAAVFGAVSSAAAYGVRETMQTPDAALVHACRKAIDLVGAYNAAIHLDEDHPELDALYAEEERWTETAITTPASAPQGLRAKAELLRSQMPLNPARETLWSGADFRDRLTWALIQDVLNLHSEG